MKSNFNAHTQGLKFADEGDSGSLVFVFSENNGEQDMRVIGMLVGGTTHRTGIVTPIWAILDNLDLPDQLLASDEQRIRKLYRDVLSGKIDVIISMLNKNSPTS